MPYSNYGGAEAWCIELNVHEIWCYLQDHLDMVYPGDIEEGSDFWEYVTEVEYELNQCDIMPDFWEWFRDYYQSMTYWKTIEKDFIDKDEYEWNQRDIRILGFNTKHHQEYGELWQDLLFEIRNHDD